MGVDEGGLQVIDRYRSDNITPRYIYTPVALMVFVIHTIILHV